MLHFVNLLDCLLRDGERLEDAAAVADLGFDIRGLDARLHAVALHAVLVHRHDHERAEVVLLDDGEVSGGVEGVGGVAVVVADAGGLDVVDAVDVVALVHVAVAEVDGIDAIM